MATEALVLRLLPAKPTDASTFRSTLANLKIEVYDLSIGDSKTGTLIGLAEGLLNITATEVEIIDDNPNIRRLRDGIWQHWRPDPLQHPSLPIDTTNVTWFSIASAIVLVNRPTHLEYGTYDLSLRISRNGSMALSTKIEYNAAPVVNLRFDAPLTGRQLDAFEVASAAYVVLPAVDLSNLDPNQAAIPDIESSMRPWKFTILLDAVNAVLTRDRPAGSNADDLKLENRQQPLTVAESKHVAAEIVWNRIIYPPPQPPSIEKLRTWYTTADQTSPANDEPGRKQFEGEVAAYGANQNSEVQRVANFVFAASAGVIAERLTRNATKLGFNFPFGRTSPISSADSPEAASYRVGLTWPNSTAGFVVPAAFFYALGCKLPAEIRPDDRWSTAVSSNEEQNITLLQTAVESGIIGDTATPLTDETQTPLGVNIYQAARRLFALGAYDKSLPGLVMNPGMDRVSALLTDWLQFSQPTDGLMLEFWEGSSGAIHAHGSAYVVLLLCLITLGSKSLIDAITVPRPTGLEVKSVEDLSVITQAEWKAFFHSHTNLLPEFTMPGTTEERTRAMIRRIQAFFHLAPETGVSSPLIPPNKAPVFEVTGNDILSEFIALYENDFGEFTFGQVLDDSQISSITTQIFPADRLAQTRLQNVVTTINDLTRVTEDTGDGRFTLIESLYARGFTSAQSISRLSLDALRRALIGTIAYASASKIRSNAVRIAGDHQSRKPVVEPFTPINGDGNLVNCIPPEHLSPLGKIAYLHELMNIPTVYGNLAQAISSRRGNLDGLLASEANLETEIPLIDIANENLEALASQRASTSPAVGRIFDTTHPAPIAHPALPEHSSPAPEVKSSAAYERLRNSFDAADLPYSQPLDVSRSYLKTMGTSRFQVMRTFREDTTEFPLPIPPNQRPIDFEKHRWRFPVEFNIALEYLQISKEEFDMLYSGKLLSVQDLQHILGFECPPPEDGTEEPPVEPPVEEPPVEEPPVEEPPVEEPPVEEPPVEEPPVEEPPTDYEPHGCTPLNTPAPGWIAGRDYAVGDFVRFEGRLYNCRQGHSSLSDWIPTRVPALWVTPLPCGITEWHWQTEYAVGSIVKYDSRSYTCQQAHISDAPNWNPGNTPALWIVQSTSLKSVLTTVPSARASFLTANSPNDSCSGSEWTMEVSRLDRFLLQTGLTYCGFLQLIQSGIALTHVSERQSSHATYPDCEPCCLKGFRVLYDTDDAIPELRKLVIFIRLRRSLERAFPGMFTIELLAEITHTLPLFAEPSGAVSPEFVRQLASLIMSHCHFHIPLQSLLHLYKVDGPADIGNLGRILDSLEARLVVGKGCRKRGADFQKVLVSNLDALAELAGFLPPATWFDCPTNTVRFLEVLTYIYESNVSVGEIAYLFRPEPHLQADDPFPMQDPQEAANDPLALPEDSQFSLWKLRNKLLDVGSTDSSHCEWSLQSMISTLDNLGIAGREPLHALAEHFFPCALQGHQIQVSPLKSFRVPLVGIDPRGWESLTCGPLKYMGEYLYLSLPLRDGELVEQLRHLRALAPLEQQAVQALYFQPRTILSPLALLFEDFDQAVESLVAGESENDRWVFFQSQFAKFSSRCEIIVQHLADHVVFTTDHRSSGKGDRALAVEILCSIMADENGFDDRTTSWEDIETTSTPPHVMKWDANLSATSFASLLGLIGTGLLQEYFVGSNLVWRDLRSTTSFFGSTARNKFNWPVPTILPALHVPPSLQGNTTITVRNGLAIRDTDDLLLGGPTPFTVVSRGSLLIERAGHYAFIAVHPFPYNGHPEHDHETGHQYHVALERGQREWTVCQQGCESTPAPVCDKVWLRRGTYQITISFAQLKPRFDDEHPQPIRTGLEMQYKGPDTGDIFMSIPRDKLFCTFKTGPLLEGVIFPGKDELTPAAYLSRRYYSTLRDIRRTYQRAFKAFLFFKRVDLCALPVPGHHDATEVRYILSHPQRFSGFSYYQQVPARRFLTHRASLDLNFIPVIDPYHPPNTSPGIDYDSRAYPTPHRQAAMFDWFERLSQYSRLRKLYMALHRPKPLWLLFREADSYLLSNPNQLLLHLGVDVSAATAALAYYTATNSGKRLEASDLIDERWTFRVWQAGYWLKQVRATFHTTLIDTALPFSWASDDPSKPITGGSSSGNTDLILLVANSLDDVRDSRVRVPDGLADLNALNNGLRLRARSALVEFLCRRRRVSLQAVSIGEYATNAADLSNILLLDVDSTVKETVTRIQSLIDSVQTLVQRAILGLEPHVTLPQNFLGRWNQQYATYNCWKSWKKQIIYAENWVHWQDLRQAKQSEGVRLLAEKLSRSTQTLTQPAESAYIPTVSAGAAHRPGVISVQTRERLGIATATTFPDEGVSLVGTPSFSGRPSLVAPFRQRQLAAASSISVTHLANNDAATHSPLAEEGLTGSNIPLWLRAAIRMGTHFIRVPASGPPPGLPFPTPWLVETGDMPCCATTDDGPFVDEYWFWIADATHFRDIHDRQDADVGSGGPLDTQSHWDSPAELPKLLQWEDHPSVYLYWTRFRYDQYEPPRCSDESLQVSPMAHAVPRLRFNKRQDDSFFFAVTAAVPRPGFPDSTKESNVGFRYDLVTDKAILIPELQVEPGDSDPGSEPDDPSTAYPAPLTSYPWFIYFAPGAPTIPATDDATVLFMAEALRSRCCFEEALNWCDKLYNPLKGNNEWEACEPDSSSTPDVAIVLHSVRRDTSCCSQTSHDPHVIRERAATLLYLDILLEYCDSRIAHSTKEGFQQARVILNAMERILGRAPQTINASDYAGSPQRLLSFVASPAPLNSRLLQLYDSVGDRKLHLQSLIANSYKPNLCQSSTDAWLRLESDSLCPGLVGPRCYNNSSHYRFAYLLPRALEAVGFLRDLGTNLMSAFEKGDAEYLASLRITHDTQIQALALDVRQNTWRESDWQVQSLEKTMEGAQTRLRYFQNLLKHGLNSKEKQHQTDTNLSNKFRTSSTESDLVSQFTSMIPDFLFGKAGVAGTPLSFQQLPVGTKLAGYYSTAARILGTFAELNLGQAGLNLTEAGWERREQEWQHTIDTTSIEIEQVKRQILSAKRRCAMNLKEVNNHQRQIEQSGEVHDFVRDKFSKQDLYLFLQAETARLYHQAHQLATAATRDALSAYLYERGDFEQSDPWANELVSTATAATILNGGDWQSLREGLMVGERLELALRTLDRKYIQRNAREYELTRHISLRLLFPLSFLQLKLTGRCVITIPEWLLDLDYPGHYMRRIKAVSITIPCVTGPYGGVHCRLRLLSSSTRVSPSLHAPSKLCCKQAPNDSDLRTCYSIVDADDSRAIRRYHHKLRPDQGGMFEIATSSGQGDSGMFEPNLRSDERYLPFEFCGVADSAWSIELPQENNQFDLHTLSDAVLHINYTSRDGGDALRQAATESARHRLPDNGVLYLDAKDDLSDAWYDCFARQSSPQKQVSRHSAAGSHSVVKPERYGCCRSPHNRRHFTLSFSRALFPFIPSSRNSQIEISRIDIFIETIPGQPFYSPCFSELETSQSSSKRPTSGGRIIDVVFAAPPSHKAQHKDIPCLVRCEWEDDVYHGILDLRDSTQRQGSGHGSRPCVISGRNDISLGTLCFPQTLHDHDLANLSQSEVETADNAEADIHVQKIYFLVRYDVISEVSHDNH